MPLVVPGVCRFAINQRFSGRPVVNVLDYFLDTTGSTEDRATACYDMAGVLLNEWQDAFLQKQVNNLTFESVSFVDLDDPDGTTGTRTTTAAHSTPANGIDPDPPLPGNTSILVHKNVAASRGTRNGRMYVCGVGEAYTTDALPNQIPSGSVASWNTMLAAFLGDTNQDEGGPWAWDSHMVVVHITVWGEPEPPNKSPVPLEGVPHTVQSLTCDGVLATQRRRMRG